MLLCCLLSLSDSLIPKERNAPTSSQGAWLLEPTYCCCWMFLPEYVNVSIQSRHNKEKQENGNVWEKSHRSPDGSKKFCPVKLVRFVEVWKVVPETKKKTFPNRCFFSDCQISPESLFSADATKKCEIARRGSDDNDADGEREQDEATLDKCPNLGRYPLKF